MYRITFSLSLANLIAKQTGYLVKKVMLHLGKEVNEKEKSNSNLYAICKSTTLWPLRVTFFKDMAKMWLNDSTRLFECKISFL